jgi:hypothetical protein
MPVVITKAIRGTSLGTAAADTQLGAATQKAPEWAKEFLALKVGGVVVTPTSAEAVHQTFRVASNDFSCYPSTVPSVFSQGSVATNNTSPSMPMEYWPCDWPIHGGDGYDIFCMAEQNNTVAPLASATVYLGDGANLPPHFDPYPHVPRFHLSGASTAIAAIPQALPDLTLTGSRAITELHGYQIDPTLATASRPQLGRIEYQSNGMFSSPMELEMEVTQGYLGAALVMPCPPKLSRSTVMMPCGPTTIVSPRYWQENTTAVVTTRGTAGLTFIR